MRRIRIMRKGKKYGWGSKRGLKGEEGVRAGEGSGLEVIKREGDGITFI